VCSESCILFGARTLSPGDVLQKSILEVGARGVGLKPLIVSWRPKEYIGVDIRAGPNVDSVVPAAHLVERFGPDRFDLVISTEMLEHIADWRTAIRNMKQVCRPGGLILITTRSPGYRLHGAPDDYWRFTPEDMRTIFSDSEILAVESDPQDPGVFVLARKQEKVPVDPMLSVRVRSIISGRPESEVPRRAMRSVRYRSRLVLVKVRDIVDYLSQRVLVRV